MIEVAAVGTLDSQAVTPTLASEMAFQADTDTFAAAMEQAAVPRAAETIPTAEQQLVDNLSQAQVTAAPGKADFAARLWDTVASVDVGYERIFHSLTPPGDAVSSASTWGSTAPGSVPTGSVTEAGIGTPDIAGMMAHSLEISLWSVQVNLLTAGVKRSTDGVQTLFRNSG